MATPLRMQKLALSMRGVLSSPATSMIARHAPNHAVSLLDRRVPNHAACRSFQGTPPLHEKFKRGWLYEFKMIFSKEAKAEREKKLKEDVNRGQFWELRELDDTGGKLFEADVGVLPAEKSVPFPSVDGFLLNGEKANTSDLLGGKVTLVTVCIRDMGRPMTDAWATLYRKEIGDQAGVQVRSSPTLFNVSTLLITAPPSPFDASSPCSTKQVVQLSFVEGSMYKIFKSSLLGALKSRTAEALHSGQIMVSCPRPDP
eukprot:1834381-Rhodomonas_salina.1